jgi:hypothetical protein
MVEIVSFGPPNPGSTEIGSTQITVEKWKMLGNTTAFLPPPVAHNAPVASIVLYFWWAKVGPYPVELSPKRVPAPYRSPHLFSCLGGSTRDCTA